MPGYSGTPLPKKLGIKAGFRVRLVNAPADVRAELRRALAECVNLDVKRGGALDFALVFTRSRAELAKEFSRMAKALSSAGMLRGRWPEKNSGVATDGYEKQLRQRRPDPGCAHV